jgi:hypothetical protein
MTKSIINKPGHMKQVLIIHYVEYINTFNNFIYNYIVFSIHIRMITSFKNELGNAHIVTVGEN